MNLLSMHHILQH